MKDWVRLFLASCSGISLASCIEFEREEIQYRHDVSADQLRMTLKYDGIFGGKGGSFFRDKKEEPRDPNKLTSQQKEQLESVLKGGRAFFFENWIFEYDRSALKEILDKFQNGEVQLEPGRTLLGKPEEKFLLAALTDIEVSNLGLYVGEKGRLCGTQTLVIKRLSNFLVTANEVIRRQVAHGIREQREKVKPSEVHPESAPSQETMALLENACDKGHNFLAIQNGRLVVTVPLGDREYLEFKQEALEKEPNPDDPGNGLPEGVSATYRNKLLTLVLGKMLDGVANMSANCFKGYRDNALRHLRKKHPQLLRDQATIKTAAEQFLSGSD